MHDISFFLLKNLLPVGVSAIAFFGIGLLLAKFIWGRFNQRLANAIEENMNLAGQWSALGASQQDLFKKLRVRWQADRDAYETVLSEKESRIAFLGDRLKSAGAEVPEFAAASVEETSARTRVRELEVSLAAERAEAEKLRDELSKLSEIPMLPFAVKTESQPAVEKSGEEDLQARIRDLEQDLIDTHDELHRVRADYQKQLNLVESLEAKLIEVPQAAPREESAQVSPDNLQLQALLTQRSREMKEIRTRLASSRSEETAALSEEIATLSTGLDARKEEISRLETALLANQGELDEAKAQLSELDGLRRRRGSLQSELNDACHELYDVRRALNLRIATIGELETQLAQLAEAEAKNVSLGRDLDSIRGELAKTIHSLALAEAAKGDAFAELDERNGEIESVRVASAAALDSARKEADEKVAELSAELEASRGEAAALATQLNEARRELSEVRIGLSAKTEDYQKALAQMEELEAIIGDRSAEVNDLSAELRQQRDQVRLLKNSLAETEGELEALSAESKALNAGVKARAAFVEEQQARVAALELALADRYRELNRVRVDAEEHSRNSRHHESRAIQLESELQRRLTEFEASDRRIATAEEALEAANVRISALSGKLESTEGSLGQLREELQQVSREKDETLRELERASRRVTELEEAARKREVQLVEIERELHEAHSLSTSLEQRASRLETELESAREERRNFEVAIAELEEALRGSDERTMQLSGRLDQKESELGGLVSELSHLQTLLDQHAAGEAEAQVRLSTLQGELESRVAELKQQNEEASEFMTKESALLSAEVGQLREQLREESVKLDEQISLRQASESEIGALRERLAARSESVRDLQSQISSVMMQRDSRDSEISLLKEKLRAMEEALRDSYALAQSVTSIASEEAAPVFDADSDTETEFEEVPTVAGSDMTAELEQSLLGATASEEGTPLDDLPGNDSHHSPAQAVESEAAGGAESSKWAGNDEDLTVFFNESASSPGQAEIEKIDRYARAIRRLGRKVEVTVIGYSGGEGTPDFNETLSARRADSVRERLVERGVSQSVMKIRAAGQDRRFTDWKARRVEIILSPVAVAETVN